MSVFPVPMSQEDITTAQSITNEMRRRGASVDDLKPKGQLLVRRFQSYLKARGFRTYREYLAQSRGEPQTTVPEEPGAQNTLNPRQRAEVEAEAQARRGIAESRVEAAQPKPFERVTLSGGRGTAYSPARYLSQPVNPYGRETPRWAQMLMETIVTGKLTAGGIAGEATAGIAGKEAVRRVGARFAKPSILTVAEKEAAHSEALSRMAPFRRSTPMEITTEGLEKGTIRDVADYPITAGPKVKDVIQRARMLRSRPLIAGPPGQIGSQTLREPLLLPSGTGRAAPKYTAARSGGERKIVIRDFEPEITITRPRTELVPRQPNPQAEAALIPPPNPQRVVFPVGGGASPQAVKQTQSPRTILNRVFGGGIGDKLAEAETVEATIMGPRNVGGRRLGLTKLSDTEDRNFTQALEGRARPISRKIADLVQWFRGVDADDAREYMRLGAKVMVAPRVTDPQTGRIIRPISFKPFQPITNHIPRMLDPRRVMKLNPMQLSLQLRASNPWLSPQDAADVVVAMRAQALGQPIPGTLRQEIIELVRGESFLPGHLHARGKLILPDSVLRPMREAIPIYMEQAAKERAFLQVFGNTADEQIDQAIQRLGGRDHHVRLAAEVWDVYRGRFIESESGRRLKQTAHILNNIATATLLGFQTAVQQPSQYAGLTGKLGVTNVIRGFVRVALRGGRIDAERAGAFVNSLTDEVVRLSDLPPTATFGDAAERVAARVASGVVRYSGIKAMDEMPRAVGFHAARFALEDAQRAALLGNQKALRLLAEVQLPAHATTDELIAKAAQLSRTLNVTANFADLPYILQTPVGAFARGLNTFNIQVTRMVSSQFLKPAIQFARTGGAEGSLAPLMRFLSAGTVIGDGIAETVRFLQGRSGDRPGGTLYEFLNDLVHHRVPNKTKVLRVLDDLGWSGTFGILDRIRQSFFQTSSQENVSRLVGGVVGAGVSSAGELAVGLPSALARAGVSDTEAERIRNLRTAGRITTRRAPAVGGVLAPRLFRSQVADRRIATQSAARAIVRGDKEGADRIVAQFTERHAANISQSALDKEIMRLKGIRSYDTTRKMDTSGLSEDSKRALGELSRLGIKIPIVPAVYSKGGIRYAVSTEEQERLTQARQLYVIQKVLQILDLPDYKGINDDQRRRAIRRRMRSVDTLMRPNPKSLTPLR